MPHTLLSCFLALILLAPGCATPSQQSVTKGQSPSPLSPTILISIDGFRPDYLDRGVTPHLNALAAAGARAQFMRPSFPSITFPNHYTLVTGLRPDHHGVVGNVMEDASIPGVRFTLGNRAATTDHRWWDEAEPIWVTAEKRGVRTATMFWPGSEAAIHDVRPTYWKPFDSKVSNAARVDTLLGWRDQSEAQRPRFLTLYFDEVDHNGHIFGPSSPEVTRAAADVDGAIGRLTDGLKARNIAANIVIVSDHGMAPVSADHLIRVDLIAPPNSFRMVNGGTFAGIEPKPGKEQALAAALRTPQSHMQCWRKAHIPARFAFGRNARVPSFLCLAQVGWLITQDGIGGETRNLGAHGYDNDAPEMHATFIAEGPSIRPGMILAPFDNVDVYPFVMRLIALRPLVSDGTIRPLESALR
jgi:predicted AlkP superfamily pyrophosphatase or phosphodiesterase